MCNEVVAFEKQGSSPSLELSLSSSSLSSLSDTEENQERQKRRQQVLKLSKRKKLHRQLSLSASETPRDKAWEKKRQILRQEKGKPSSVEPTDEDMDELKGCIELGFGFKEEEGHGLCNTLPALDLYFAVNRQISPSPVSTPQSRGESGTELSGRSSFGSDDWKICSPGENPQQVKTRLRHWAQAVACSLMQSPTHL